MKNCILILILLATLTMHAQQGFQTIINTSFDQYVNDIFVYNNNYLVIGGTKLADGLVQG
jgi:succinate dehydrogenase hydrophobic anchor subunit